MYLADACAHRVRGHLKIWNGFLTIGACRLDQYKYVHKSLVDYRCKVQAWSPRSAERLKQIQLSWTSEPLPHQLRGTCPSRPALPDFAISNLVPRTCTRYRDTVPYCDVWSSSYSEEQTGGLDIKPERLQYPDIMPRFGFTLLLKESAFRVEAPTDAMGEDVYSRMMPALHEGQA